MVTVKSIAVTVIKTLFVFVVAVIAFACFVVGCMLWMLGMHYGNAVLLLAACVILVCVIAPCPPS